MCSTSAQEVSSGVCLVLKDKSNAYLCSRPLILLGSFFFLPVRSQRYSNGTLMVRYGNGTKTVWKRYGTETSTKFFFIKGIAWKKGFVCVWMCNVRKIFLKGSVLSQFRLCTMGKFSWKVMWQGYAVSLWGKFMR